MQSNYGINSEISVGDPIVLASLVYAASAAAFAAVAANAAAAR